MNLAKFRSHLISLVWILEGTLKHTSSAKYICKTYSRNSTTLFDLIINNVCICPDKKVPSKVRKRALYDPLPLNMIVYIYSGVFSSQSRVMRKGPNKLLHQKYVKNNDDNYDFFHNIWILSKFFLKETNTFLLEYIYILVNIHFLPSKLSWS